MSLQHVVVIGGSSGIGLATAKLLLKQGYTVTIAGRDGEKLAAAKASLDGDLRSVVLDATVLSRLGEAFAGIGAFGHLVLAMGSGHGAGPFATLDMTDLLAGFQTKLIPHAAAARRLYRCCSRAAASPSFRRSARRLRCWHGWACGRQCRHRGDGAGACRRAEAAACQRRFRVVDTPWWSFLPSEQRGSVFADFAGRTPVGRVGRPEDIAEAIVFLIGNGFMSGHVVTCDGGVRLSA